MEPIVAPPLPIWRSPRRMAGIAVLAVGITLFLDRYEALAFLFRAGGWAAVFDAPEAIILGLVPTPFLVVGGLLALMRRNGGAVVSTLGLGLLVAFVAILRAASDFDAHGRQEMLYGALLLVPVVLLWVLKRR